MNTTEKLEMLKALTGEENNAILEVYLKVATDEIIARAYPFASDDVLAELEFPSKYDVLSVRIAESIYLRAGAEGEISHAENGITRSYRTDGIPTSLLRQIVPYCGVP